MAEQSLSEYLNGLKIEISPKPEPLPPEQAEALRAYLAAQAGQAAKSKFGELPKLEGNVSLENPKPAPLPPEQAAAILEYITKTPPNSPQGVQGVPPLALDPKGETIPPAPNAAAAAITLAPQNASREGVMGVLLYEPNDRPPAPLGAAMRAAVERFQTENLPPQREGNTALPNVQALDTERGTRGGR